MNEGIYNKLISSDILTVFKVRIFGMTWICDGVDGEGHVTGRETRRREKKRKTQIEVNGR
jgi:hypothetical protein